MFDFYPVYEYQFARVQLVCFMLAMGATLSVRDFLEVTRRPRSFLAGLAVHLLVLPWLAVLLDNLFALPEGIAVGLILASAMPGGAMSKFFCYLGRGNAALSISLTMFSTLASLVTVPLLLQLLAARYMPDDFRMPVGEIVIDVSVCLLLPTAVGMAIARLWPAHRTAFARWCVRIGFVVVVAMVVGAFGSGRIRPAEYGLAVPVAIILFCVVGQQLAMLPFYFLPWPRADRMAVGIEVTMRNMNLALLIKARLFPEADELGNGVLFVTLFNAGAAMAAGLPLALNHRRLSRREKAPVAT
jgi:BASS family bile acid:Na+ symporter